MELLKKIWNIVKWPFAVLLGFLLLTLGKNHLDGKKRVSKVKQNLKEVDKEIIEHKEDAKEAQVVREKTEDKIKEIVDNFEETKKHENIDDAIDSWNKKR